MKGFKVLAIALLLLTVASAAMAADAINSDVGKSWTITLNHPTRVGTALLPTGDYKVQHLKDGGQHFLAFKSGRKEITRVGCTMEELPKKAIGTLLFENTNGAGEQVLEGIAFDGDSFQHDLVNP